MNTYQLILSHITAVLFCFSLYHLGKVFIVHKKLNNYAYFCIATLAAVSMFFWGCCSLFRWPNRIPSICTDSGFLF